MKIKKINILDFFTLSLSIISLISVFFLSINKFIPILSLIIGILISIFIYLLFNAQNITLNAKSSGFGIGLLLIISLSLAIRYEPFQYVLGGQDEGVYYNMAHYYNKNGSNFIKDDFYHVYKGFNLEKIYQHGFFNKNNYLPGIYIYNKNNFDYVFQFYSLHPIWMSIFIAIGGSKFGVYSLTMFSILSIIFIYLLTKEVFNSEKAGYLASLFLAFHPVHAYFSKFPVTEVVALFFTLSSFYYLVKFYKLDIKNKLNKTLGLFYLFLSTLLITGFFFTRISGFMYMPFFYLLFLLNIIFNNGKKLKYLSNYFVVVFIGYFISVIYGLYISPFYSRDIYRLSFAKSLGNNWINIIFILIFTAIIFLIFVYFFRQEIKRLILPIANLLSKRLYLFFYFIFTLGIYRVYTLAFTNKFVSNAWIHNRWKMDNLGVRSLHFSSFISLIIYLSPLLFLILIYGVYFWSKKTSSVYVRLLIVFLMLFWFYTTVFKFTIPYKYYYSRYLLSEVIPYSLILISGTLGCFLRFKSKKNKFILYGSYFIALSSIIYFAYFSCQQIGKVEQKETYNSLSNIVAPIDNNDVLFLLTDHFKQLWQIKTSLIFTFNLPTINLNKIQNICNQNKIISLWNKNGDIYLLSFKQINIPIFDLVNKTGFEYSTYTRTRFFPKNILEISYPIYLYKKNNFPLDKFCNNTN